MYSSVQSQLATESWGWNKCCGDNLAQMGFPWIWRSDSARKHIHTQTNHWRQHSCVRDKCFCEATLFVYIHDKRSFLWETFFLPHHWYLDELMTYAAAKENGSVSFSTTSWALFPCTDILKAHHWILPLRYPFFFTSISRLSVLILGRYAIPLLDEPLHYTYICILVTNRQMETKKRQGENESHGMNVENDKGSSKGTGR